MREGLGWHQLGMDTDAEAFRCFFETADGTVLSTQDAWDSAEDATLHGEQILANPGDYELCDPDGHPVDATEIDADAEFTVEPVDPDTLD